jgi:hypothetical protein
MRKQSNAYRVFPEAEKIIIKELVRRVKVGGRAFSKQEVLNAMILEYPQMLEQIKKLIL